MKKMLKFKRKLRFLKIYNKNLINKRITLKFNRN